VDTGALRASQNDAADNLARQATLPGKTHPFSPFVSRDGVCLKRDPCPVGEKKIIYERGHLRWIDNTPPGKYTRRLYGSLPRNRAYMLTQLRAGRCWLHPCEDLPYLQDNDRCVYGNQVTVTHVLWDWPNMRDLGRELRGKSVTRLTACRA
jgi:hypothetical protein